MHMQLDVQCVLFENTCQMGCQHPDGRKDPDGVCVRMSEKHAGNVPLILNFKTGNITVQWNAVFDDWFSTVAINVKDTPDFHADE